MLFLACTLTSDLFTPSRREVALINFDLSENSDFLRIVFIDLGAQEDEISVTGLSI
jgi:hypothetical protein